MIKRSGEKREIGHSQDEKRRQTRLEKVSGGKKPSKEW